MKKINLVLLIYSLFHFGVAACDESKDIILVTAKAVEAKMVRKLENESPRDVLFEYIFRMTFEDIIVEQGKSDIYPNTATFDIELREPAALLNAHRIYLFIDQSDPKNHRLLKWGYVYSSICLEKETYIDGYEHLYFQYTEFDKQENRHCTMIEYGYTPSDVLSED